MHIKTDLQGVLIYLSLAGYAAALVSVAIKRKPNAGQLCFAFAFSAATASYIVRWVLHHHLPMQNLFEVFLLMGVLIWPIAMLTRRLLGRNTGILSVNAEQEGCTIPLSMTLGDALLGVLVMFPAGFVFSAAPRPLPPALQSVLFGPHVASYMIAYILMARSCVPAAAALAGRYKAERLIEAERLSYGMTAAAFPLLTLGLVLGSIWGKLAWGDWWAWDPKELWSLACWLMYAVYFHWRIVHPKEYIRTRLWLVLTGMVFIVITLLWVNLSRIFAGLHNYAASGL